MSVPILYRCLFGLFDIVMPIGGVIGNLLAPITILQNFTPHAVVPPATETILLLDGMAGFFASLALVSAALQWKRPHDVGMWRIVQAGAVLIDVFMLLGFGRALVAEGRTSVSTWRSDDWSNIGGYAVITLVRLGFVCGFGLPRATSGTYIKKRA